MLFTIAIATTAFVLLICLVVAKQLPAGDDPPSPGWVPILGSLPFLRLPMEKFLAEKFGQQPLAVMHIGLEKLYCLNSYEAVRDALVVQGDKFAARPQSVVLRELTGEAGGLIMSSGQQWQDYRRFTLKTLRDFGFGRQGAEEIIRDEVQILCQQIDKNSNASMNSATLFSTAISNVICTLVFGSRLASEDPKFDRILQIFKIMTQSLNNGGLTYLLVLNIHHLQRIPSLLRFLLLMRRGRTNRVQELIDFCRQQMEQHREHLGDPNHPKDFIEAHLHHQETHPQFNDIRLTLSIMDLFLAGTDTTSHTIRWAIIFMIENPKVAERVFQEINNEVGQSREIGANDRSKLNFTMATLEEVHRCASLAPLAVFHRVTEEAKVCGYTIPKDAVVIYNTYNIHHDSRLFPQPHKFKPERFLNDSGRFSPSEHVVAFGVGKRSCLGESLARMELFIFFATLMQKYRFSIDTSDGRSLEEIKENLEGAGGGIRAPADYRVVFESR